MYVLDYVTAGKDAAANDVQRECSGYRVQGRRQGGPGPARQGERKAAKQAVCGRLNRTVQKEMRGRYTADTADMSINSIVGQSRSWRSLRRVQSQVVSSQGVVRRRGRGAGPSRSFGGSEGMRCALPWQPAVLTAAYSGGVPGAVAQITAAGVGLPAAPSAAAAARGPRWCEWAVPLASPSAPVPKAGAAVLPGPGKLGAAAATARLPFACSPAQVGCTGGAARSRLAASGTPWMPGTGLGPGPATAPAPAAGRGGELLLLPPVPAAPEPAAAAARSASPAAARLARLASPLLGGAAAPPPTSPTFRGSGAARAPAC